MNLLSALLLAAAALVTFVVHEIAAATAAGRLGDRSPVRWGRRSLDPRKHVDPFGSVLLPLIGIGLAASGTRFPVFAYGRPMPSDPGAFRSPRSGPILVALAGPAAQVLLAAVAGLVLRGIRAGLPLGGAVASEAAYALLTVASTMAAFNLVPIPGLDGSRILTRFLPSRAAEVYRGLDGYLPLFLLVILFVFPGPVLLIVRGLASGICYAVSGGPLC